MSVTNAGYSVAKGTGVCAASGRAFTPGEEFMAALIEKAGEPGLSRLDYSLEAWERGPRPANVLGSWRVRFTPNPPARHALLSDEELLDLFEELSGATEARRLSFRYLLALLLVRRRVLRLVGEKRVEGKGVIVVKARRDGDGAPELEVVDPGMDDAAVADAIDQLGQVVGGDAARG